MLFREISTHFKHFFTIFLEIPELKCIFATKYILERIQL